MDEVVHLYQCCMMRRDRSHEINRHDHISMFWYFVSPNNFCEV